MKRNTFVLIFMFVFTAGAAQAATDLTAGGTIDLTEDLEISQVQTITKDTTIKSSQNKKIVIKITKGITVTGGTLTLGEGLTISTDSTGTYEGIVAEGSGAKIIIDGATIDVINTDSANAFVYGYDGATLEVKSGTVKTDSDSPIGVRYGNLKISGGTITSTNGGAAVFAIGTAEGEGKIEIEGGEISAYTNSLLACSDGGDATITVSGNETKSAGPIVTWLLSTGKVNLIINGGDFTADYACTDGGTITFNDGTFNIGRILAAYLNTDDEKCSGTININGGTFTNTDLELISEDKENDIKGSLTIKGGKFPLEKSDDVKLFVPSGYDVSKFDDIYCTVSAVTSNGSSGGCNLVRSEELGVRNILLFVAFFALAFKKIFNPSLYNR